MQHAWKAVIGVVSLSLAVVFAAGASASAVPNPCRLVSSAAISAAFGSKGGSLAGVASTRPDGPVKQSVCTFKHLGVELMIYVSPHQPIGGSGGPPGMVITKPSGLGKGATFAYDLNPQFRFSNIFFTKGSLDAGVHDNGKLPRPKVLALARTVYAALPRT